MHKAQSSTSFLLKPSTNKLYSPNNPYEAFIIEARRNKQKLKGTPLYAGRNSPDERSIKTSELGTIKPDTKPDFDFSTTKDLQSLSKEDLDRTDIVKQTSQNSLEMTKGENFADYANTRKQIQELKKKNTVEFEMYQKIRNEIRAKDRMLRKALSISQDKLNLTNIRKQNDLDYFKVVENQTPVLPKLANKKVKDIITAPEPLRRQNEKVKSSDPLCSERINRENESRNEIVRMYMNSRSLNKLRKEPLSSDKVNNSLEPAFHNRVRPNVVITRSKEGSLVKNDQKMNEGYIPSNQSLSSGLKNKSFHYSSQGNLRKEEQDPLRIDEVLENKKSGNGNRDALLQKDNKKSEQDPTKILDILSKTPNIKENQKLPNKNTTSIENSFEYLKAKSVLKLTPSNDPQAQAKTKQDKSDRFEKTVGNQTKPAFYRPYQKLSQQFETKKLNDKKILILPFND